jgi:hypothetical protein
MMTHTGTRKRGCWDEEGGRERRCREKDETVRGRMVSIAHEETDRKRR